MSNQTGRYLRTEELYKKVVEIADHDAQVCQVELDETKLRGILEAIITQGKIEGRLSAYNDGRMFHASPDDDRLIEDWQTIVDSAS